MLTKPPVLYDIQVGAFSVIVKSSRTFVWSSNAQAQQIRSPHHSWIMDTVFALTSHFYIVVLKIQLENFEYQLSGVMNIHQTNRFNKFMQKIKNLASYISKSPSAWPMWRHAGDPWWSERTGSWWTRPLVTIRRRPPGSTRARHGAHAQTAKILKTARKWRCLQTIVSITGRDRETTFECLPVWK